MNEDYLKSKIIDHLLKLPVGLWKRMKNDMLFSADYSSYTIILNTGNGNYRPHISINDIDIYDDRISNLVTQVRDHEKSCYEKRTLESLHEICSNLGLI